MLRWQPNNQLQLIDLQQRRLVGHVDLGDSPEGVSISADGRWVAAAVEESNEIVITDTTSNQRAFSIKVKGRNPEPAVFSPDGRYIFVSAEEGTRVDNLSDKRYVGSVIVNQSAAQFYEPAAGRNWTVGLRAVVPL